MMRSVRLEMMKWKRSRLLAVAGAGAALTPLIALASFLSRARGLQAGQSLTWNDLFSFTLQLQHLMLMPILFGALAAFIFVQEFQDGSVVNLYTLPVSRLRIACAKLLTLLLLMTGVTVLAYLLSIPVGMLFLGPIPAAVFTKFLGVSLLTGMMLFLLLPVPIFVGVWTRHFIPPVVTGASFVFLSFLAIALPDGLGWRVPTAIPYYVDLYAVGYFKEPPPHTWILLIPIAILFTTLSLITVVRRDVS